MKKPKLTRNQIIAAFAVAVVADILEFPITAAEATVVGAPAGELGACVLDTVVFGIMTRLLGFHWMFLPSFVVEVIPGLNMFPTWVGCVAFVVWKRKKEEAQPSLADVVDVHAVEDITAQPAPSLTLPPPLLLPAHADIPAQPPPPILTATERRLIHLNELRDKNLISQTEYDAKRQHVLADF